VLVRAPMASLEPTAVDPHRYRVLCPRAPEGPLDLPSLLPGSGDIELEIGFGHGRFLYERAQVAQGSRLVGLEVKTKWATLVADRVRERGLHNVTVWGSDARMVLPRIAASTVRRVFMHFPDPWWKKRHQKRMLTGRALLDELARILVPEGEFFMQTDVDDRADLHLEALREHGAFTLTGEGGVVAHNPYGARSNREARAEEDGLPVTRTLAIRR
jgi:tRNA (guanine-N7-)-methyltransferase